MDETASGGSPPADLTFGRLGPPDWARLRAARLAALADAPYAFGSTLEREQGFTEELWRSRTETGAIFAAWSPARILGLATARSDTGADGWHIVGMWVDPALRGRGVADTLLRLACEHARAEGAASITLWVTELNDRARAFYRRLGLRPTGARQLVRPEDPGHFEEELALSFG